MQTFLTIIAGVFVFILGQLALKLFIEPIQEFRRTVADVSLALIEYANIYANPGVSGEDIGKRVSEELRKLSARLNALVYLLPLYNCTSKLFGLPSKNNVVNAASDLIGLSNGVFKSAANLVDSNLERAERIRKRLGIFTPDSE